MNTDLEIFGTVARIVAEYGILGIGWLGWFFERRKNHKLTTQLINFLAKQELIKEAPSVF